MKNFAKLATAAMSISALALVATSADAQSRRNRDRAPAAEAPATPPVSREFAAAYTPLQTQLSASAWAAADPLLAAAQAAAVNPYEKYLVARADYLIATGLNNQPRRSTAATAMIDSGGITPSEQRAIYSLGSQLAYGDDNYAVAAARAKRALELGSAEDSIRVIAVDALVRSGQLEPAIAEARGQIASAQSSGSRVPELVYTQLAAGLQEAGRDADVLDWLTQRYQAYPTVANLRNNALIFLNSLPSGMDGAVERSISIDTLRLLSASGAMSERRFYVEYVTSLAEDALPNEVLTAIAAGRGSSLIPASGSDSTFDELERTATDNVGEDRTSLGGSESRAVRDVNARLATRVANAYYAYENFAKAEVLLTLALTKAEADADLINLRLGQARFRQGNAAGALEALGQVQGLRAPLAKLWSAYVATTVAAAPAAPAASPTAPAGM